MAETRSGPADGMRIGPLDVLRVAHGGHCVARHDGRVIFVRHTIPGERVFVTVTDSSRDSYWWADAIEIVEPSPDRVDAPCPIAGVCGGCDFQHVSLPRQRALKGDVVKEQLNRLAGLDLDVIVEPVSGDDDGLGYRTRMRYLAAPGRVGLRAWRSDELVALPESGCAIADVAGPSTDELRKLATRVGELTVAIADNGVAVATDEGQLSGPTLLSEHVSTGADRSRDYQVGVDGFWQVHTGAADTLVAAVLEALDPQAGMTALDLYCGVGLFAGALAQRGVDVLGVEGSKQAIAHAKRNVPEATFVAGRMDRMLRQLPKQVDQIVLDPPRAGAGKEVVKHLARMGASRIAYVACDPAALARDVATFERHGYRLASLRAFDLFPMTHHVECVALLIPEQLVPERRVPEQDA